MTFVEASDSLRSLYPNAEFVSWLLGGGSVWMRLHHIPQGVVAKTWVAPFKDGTQWREATWEEGSQHILVRSGEWRGTPNPT